MKNLNIFVLVVAIAFLAVSCTTISPSEVKGVTKVVEVPGVSKDDLFVRASTWMVDMFNSAKNVIQFSDKDAGVIKGKYIITFPQFLATGECEATITIECKDGKCRIVVDDPYGFRVDDVYSNRIENLTQEGFDKISTSIRGLCDKFEKYITINPDVSW